MIDVNFSFPYGHKFFPERSARGECRFNNCQFDFSGNRTVTDVWVVWGDLMRDREYQEMSLQPGALWFITDEAHDQKKYHPKFLAQFDCVLSLRDDIGSNNLYPIHELNTWMMDLPYDQAVREGIWEKSKMMSLVSSNLTDLPGHRARLELVRLLQMEFPNEIDFFGRGINPIENKLHALAPYKYSIAIENNSKPGYFTEKLTECFLTETLPLYFGCPDIENYFPSDSLIYLNIDQPSTVVEKVGRVLKDDPYQKHLQAIRSAKKLFLEEYHIFVALSHLIERRKTAFGSEKQFRGIRSNRSFLAPSLFQRVINRLKLN